jgi:hypothetical protein
MMALPSLIAPKIGKLIPRLASTHDGEVVATARAIGRILRAAGSDWHDVAAAMEGRPLRAAAAEPPGSTWRDLVDWLQRNDHNRLSAKERAFIDDMGDQLRSGRSPSPRQGKWLHALHGRLRAEGRRA